MMFFPGVASRVVCCAVLRQGKRIGDGSSICSVVPAKSIVVPANAGIHTPRTLRRKVGPAPRDNSCRRWLWVPASAGTTRGELPLELHRRRGNGLGWFVNIQRRPCEIHCRPCERRDPYVDGPRAARVFSGLIGSLASICPAC